MNDIPANVWMTEVAPNLTGSEVVKACQTSSALRQTCLTNNNFWLARLDQDFPLIQANYPNLSPYQLYLYAMSARLIPVIVAGQPASFTYTYIKGNYLDYTVYDLESIINLANDDFIYFIDDYNRISSSYSLNTGLQKGNGNTITRIIISKQIQSDFKKASLEIMAENEIPFAVFDPVNDRFRLILNVNDNGASTLGYDCAKLAASQLRAIIESFYIAPFNQFFEITQNPGLSKQEQCQFIREFLEQAGLVVKIAAFEQTPAKRRLF